MKPTRVSIALHCTFTYRCLVRSFSCLAVFVFSPTSNRSSQQNVLQNKSKRKNKCPGCGTPKDIHDFAAMGKHCEGPDEPDPADALSRLQVQRFRKLVPDADLLPTPVLPLNLADFK